MLLIAAFSRLVKFSARRFAHTQARTLARGISIQGRPSLRRSKRGKGEGSIYPNAKGVWTAVVSMPGGRRKYMYGSTREDVRRRLALALAAQEGGALLDGHGLSVGEFLDQWLKEVARPSVRPWTFRGYEVHVRRHIKPVLGGIPLERLEPVHVQSLMNRKLAEGLSPKSVRYLRGTLRTALNVALRWGLVVRNAASLVVEPRVERHEILPFGPDEARRFLTVVKGHRMEALYMVALTMGLRQGEVLGLRWREVDLEMGYLKITKQLQRINGVFELVDPKTSRSRRTIVMPPMVSVALRDHRTRQQCDRPSSASEWNQLGLVFTRPDGHPLDGTVVTHQFHRLLYEARLPQRRFHDLRHSCATLLLAQGVAARVVMEVLGHSQIGITMNTYTHVIPELQKDAADRMESLLAGRD